jgi:hypothetical protein
LIYALLVVCFLIQARAGISAFVNRC